MLSKRGGLVVAERYDDDLGVGTCDGMIPPMFRSDDLVEVVGAVIVREDLVLACRRAPGRASAGLWEFPGGKVEPKETRQSALVREINEELGVDVEIGVEIATVTRPELGIRLTTMMARLVGDDPDRSSDHDRLLWIPRHDLLSLDWAAADMPTVELLLAGLRREDREA